MLSGMIGGIEFYDISNPEVLNHLGNLHLSSGGGGAGFYGGKAGDGGSGIVVIRYQLNA